MTGWRLSKLLEQPDKSRGVLFRNRKMFLSPFMESRSAGLLVSAAEASKGSNNIVDRVCLRPLHPSLGSTDLRTAALSEGNRQHVLVHVKCTAA